MTAAQTATAGTPCKNCGLELHFTPGVPLHLQHCPSCNYRQDGPGRTTAPRWITEALDASWQEGRAFTELADRLAKEMFERWPIEEITRGFIAATSPEHREELRKGFAAIIVAMTNGADTDVVELTELYQNAARVLDTAGVPYAAPFDADPGAVQVPLDLAGRIRWLAAQRPTRLELQRVEAERDGARATAEEQIRIAIINALASLAREVGADNEAINAWVTNTIDGIAGMTDLALICLAVLPPMPDSVAIGEYRGAMAEVERQRDRIAELERKLADRDAEIEGIEAEVAELEAQLYEVDPDEIGGEG